MKLPDVSGRRLHHYHLEIVTEGYIPHDVLIEHLAVAMRDFQFLGMNSIALRGTSTTQKEPEVARNHPFEGPEVFDDYIPGTAREGSFMPADPFPLTTQVIDRLKETRKHGND